MKTLYIRDRKDWRSWLQKNGQSERQIWLIYPKKNSSEVRIPYDHAVEEALCFGWIDGMTRKLNEQRFIQRFTPRRPASRWSEINIKRARKLIKSGLMTAAGLAVFRPERKIAPHPIGLPGDLEAKLHGSKKAWENFQRFPPFYRRMTIAWVASANKEETQLRRLKQLIQFSTQNKRIKFM
ncbi:MAG: YdeI/OmpD-associated family protein [Acidobacteriia bacterium]|nr:YdeI/OmpD-associated family protein [Terriglobia bacterium]